MRLKQHMLSATKPGTWNRVLCIDPGIRHLGYAFWPIIKRAPGAHTVAPKDSGLITTSPRTAWEAIVYEELAAWLRRYITTNRVRHVVIETATFWSESARSRQAAKRGDLLRLVFLVGALGEVAYELCAASPVTVEPKEWKGDMPKDVMKKRVRRALHRKYREHEYDGVAIGLRIMGKL